jgi:hypothetical protein
MEENRYAVIERLIEKDCCTDDEELQDAFLKVIMEFTMNPSIHPSAP